MATGTAATLIERDLRCIWHPWKQHAVGQAPLLITHGQGVYLYGENQKWIDGISSWWVNLHGHAHPAMVAAITAQAQKLEHTIFTDFTHAPAVELAEQLLQLLPSNLSRVFYSDNGATAVEIGIKMALQYWHNLQKPRRTIVCFKQSFHGETFGAMSAAGKNAFNQPFWPFLFDVQQIDPPFAGAEERSLEQLRAIFRSHSVACFVFEPCVLGVGGMRTYPLHGLAALITECRHHGVIPIADEVMTGFGRTGPLFASSSCQPDIVCLAKGLTGGFLPLGATVSTEKIFRAFLGSDMRPALLHGHSYTANPLACAAALASLKLLETAPRVRIAAKQAQFCQQWRSRAPLKRCESIGTLLILEYMAESTYFHPISQRLSTFFLERGVLLRPLGNVIYFMPPYCISDAELNEVHQLLVESWKIS